METKPYAKYYKTKMYLFNLIFIPVFLFFVFFLINRFNNLAELGDVVSIIVFILLSCALFVFAVIYNVYIFTLTDDIAEKRYENFLKESKKEKVANQEPALAPAPAETPSPAPAPVAAPAVQEVKKEIYYDMNSLNFWGYKLSLDFHNNLFCVIVNGVPGELYKISNIVSIDVLNNHICLISNTRNQNFAGLLDYNNAQMEKSFGPTVNNWKIELKLNDKKETSLFLPCVSMEMAIDNSKQLTKLVFQKEDHF